MAISDEYYKILELEPGASLAEVKSAFRQQAKEWHPDKYPYDSSIRKRCEERMTKINEAYQFLRRFVPDAGDSEPKPEAKPPPETWGWKPQRPPWEDEEQPPPRPESKRQAPKPPPEPERRTPEPPPEPETAPEPALAPYLGDAEPPPKTSWVPFRRHVPLDEADYQGVFQVGAAFAASIFTLAALFFLSLPVSTLYFEIVRIVVGLSTLYGGIFAISRKYWEISLPLILLSAVLNPVFPVSMSIEEWRIFNFLLPSALLYFWWVIFERESKKL